MNVRCHHDALFITDLLAALHAVGQRMANDRLINALHVFIDAADIVL